MIAVDSSALLAIIFDEPQAGACAAVLGAQTKVIVSAGTMAEALIVASGRGMQNELLELIEDLSFEVVNVTPAAARRISEIYRKWGKGFHPAGLNFGDCFAYEAAKEHGCPLLYVGGDFSKTDIVSAPQ